MELQQLIYFRCVAQTEHMGEAAEILHISQPALSMSIKSLEGELGVPLFDRIRKNIVLNRYGIAFLGYAERALTEIDQGKKELLAMKSLESNRVITMCPPAFMSQGFMELLFSKHPDIFIENKSMNYVSAPKEIASGSLDICAVAPMIEGPKIANIPIRKQKMGIAMHSSHRLAGRKTLLFKDVAGELFAAYPSNTVPRKHLEDCCRKAGFLPRIIYEAASINDMLNPVRAGHCIAYVAEPSIKHYNTSQLVFVPMDESEGAVTTFGISYRGDIQLRPVVQDLLDLIVEYASDKNVEF